VIQKKRALLLFHLLSKLYEHTSVVVTVPAEPKLHVFSRIEPVFSFESVFFQR